jgi:hypothetical protein
LLFPPGSPTTVTGATEDANAVYWELSDGSVNSCSAVFCQRQLLVSGQNFAGDIQQDASNLYWGTVTASGGGQVMRLVK